MKNRILIALGLIIIIAGLILWYFLGRDNAQDDRQEGLSAGTTDLDVGDTENMEMEVGEEEAAEALRNAQ